MHAATTEIALLSRDAGAEAAVLPRFNTEYLSTEYYVPVDPMDDLHCDSCQ